MPAGIPGIALARKSYRECAKRWEWPPTANPDELVNRGNEARRVCRRTKRWIEVTAQPDDRASPGRAVERVTSGVTPQDLASFFRTAAQKGRLEPHKTVPDKSLNVARGENRTGNSILLGSHTSIFSASDDARVVGQSGSRRAGYPRVHGSCRDRLPLSGRIAPRSYTPHGTKTVIPERMKSSHGARRSRANYARFVAPRKCPIRVHNVPRLVQARLVLRHAIRKPIALPPHTFPRLIHWIAMPWEILLPIRSLCNGTLNRELQWAFKFVPASEQ